MSQGRAFGSADDWESHWTNYAESNELNPAQEYRRRLIEQALGIERATGQVKLLELGSGHGELAGQLMARFPGIELVGLDRAEAGLASARRKAPRGVFVQADLTLPESLPRQFAGFATHAVCSEVLEHVDDPVPLLRNARALFAPGCRLVVTVPAGPLSAFDRHIGHRRHYTPESLGDLLRAAGFRDYQVTGARFPFFNLYRLTVVARGAALIRDAGGEGKPLPLAARLAMQGFSRVFRFNRDEGRRGWQLIATAIEPGASA